MPTKELVISLARHPVPWRTAIEPLPDPYDAPIELQKALRVCWSAVVLVVAPDWRRLKPVIHVRVRLPVESRPRDKVATMVTDSQWQALKVELRKEARSLFYSMSETVLIEPDKKSHAIT
jgi:hypothetical protein